MLLKSVRPCETHRSIYIQIIQILGQNLWTRNRALLFRKIPFSRMVFITAFICVFQWFNILCMLRCMWALLGMSHPKSREALKTEFKFELISSAEGGTYLYSLLLLLFLPSLLAFRLEFIHSTRNVGGGGELTYLYLQHSRVMTAWLGLSGLQKTQERTHSSLQLAERRLWRGGGSAAAPK